MKSGFFSAISRLRWIQRWSLKRNTLAENVMEHSWEVAVIAHMLGCINNRIYEGDVNPDRLSTLALYHDSSEAITGDLPTPVKYYSVEIQKAYRVIEKDAEHSLVAMLPEPIQSVFSEVICGEGVSEIETKLVKAADNLSAYIKGLAELANGNNEYDKTVGNLKERIMDYQLPEVEYFLKHFVDNDHNRDKAIESGNNGERSSNYSDIFDKEKVRMLKLAR